MSARGLGGVGVACLSLLSGCYRSATFEPGKITRIDHQAEERLVVTGADGSRTAFESYDSVGVEIENHRDSEFEKPAFAEQRPEGLVVTGLHSGPAFPLRDVKAVTVWEHAPERPWIIAASTVGAMLLGGFIGYHAAGECHEDAEMGCYGNAIFSFAGGVLGGGLGLGISIPVTGSLSPSKGLH